MSSKAKRYTPSQKSEILNYIAQFNNKNGRGGQTAAAKKFGVSQLSLSKWVNEGTTPARAGRPAKGTAATKSKDLDKKLAQLKKLNGQIAKTEQDLAALKDQFQAVVKSI